MARTSRTPKMRLGELLVAAGLVSDEKVRMGLEEQRRNNLFLGEALVQLGFVTEEAIAQAIIQHFNLPFLSASQFNIPPEVFNLFPERMYNEYQFIAVDKIERVIIAIAAGPINQDMMEELERVSECKICHYVSTWRDINAAIQHNSKELGGQSQVELTGLGSMLLDTPNGASKAGTSITQKIKKLGDGASVNGIATSRPTVPKPLPGPTKTLAAANLSAMLSPLGVSARSSGITQVASMTPPSPRLTAFLKVPAPGYSSSGLPAVGNRSSSGLPAVRMGGASSANLSAITAGMSGSMMSAVNVSSAGFPTSAMASSAGMPAVNKDKEKEAAAKKHDSQPPKRMSSFLQIRK